MANQLNIIKGGNVKDIMYLCTVIGWRGHLRGSRKTENEKSDINNFNKNIIFKQR